MIFNKRQLKQGLWNWRGIWVATPLSALFVIGLRSLGALQGIELALFDHYLQLRPSLRSDPRIAIVGIDEGDVKSLGQAILPDRTYAQLLERLLAMEPIAIGLDIYRDVPIEPGHDQLVKLFEGSDRIIGIEKVIGDRQTDVVPPPPTLKAKGQIAANDLITDIDNRVRRGLLTLNNPQGETRYGLGAYLAMLYLAREGLELKTAPGTDNWWQLGNSTLIPLEANQGSYINADAGGYQTMLDYRGSRNTFEIVSLRQVLLGKLPPDWGRDRLILIGFVGDSFKDIFATPHSNAPDRLMSGVEIHANLASQLIDMAQGHRLPWRTGSELIENIWIVLWAGIGATLAWFWRRTSKVLLRSLVMIAVVGAFLAGTYWAFLNYWWIPVVPALLAFSLSVIGILGYLAYTAETIRKIFGRYLSNEVVDTLLENQEGLKLGGEKRQITILTSDLRGFTQLTERLSPEEVLKILNFYLATMADVIADYQGTINEFEGDGILVFFGVPVQREDDPQRAIACALTMQQAMAKVNQQLQTWGFSSLAMGIGIHTGEAVVGNIGSEKRTKYGAVGNTVNLAFRIESYTIGGQILISDRTRQAVTQEVALGETLVVRPKGVKHPISVHSVLGIRGKYTLQLPQFADNWRSLPTPLPVQYSILHDKDISQTVYQGQIKAIAASKAKLSIQPESCPSSLKPLGNLRLNILSPRGDSSSEDIYAKLVTFDDPTFTWTIHFTTLPPFLDSSLSSPATDVGDSRSSGEKPNPNL